MPKPVWSLLLITALALACGPAQQPAADAGGGPSQPRYGGILNLAVQADPFDWDLSLGGRSTPNQYGVSLATNGLTRFKSGPEVEYTENILLPDLAERWEVSSDAKTFTFHLRRGVKFQDVPPLNGREFTSADVRWTLEYRSRSGDYKKLPRDSSSYMFDNLDRVETPDPYTAVIRFNESFPPFLNYTGSRWNTMLPREVYEKDGHLKDLLVGTGAYILDTGASQKGTRWVFKKNPNYFEQGKPYIDEIRWLVTPSEGSQQAAFQTKQIDQVDRLAYLAFQEIKRMAPQAESFKYYATNAQQMQTSHRSGSPFGDVRVRRAISMAVDRDEINRTVAGGEGLWAIPGAVAGTYSQEETKKLVPQDLAAAKRLLAEAGYNTNVEPEWLFPSNESQDNLAMYQLVQSQVKRIGVNPVLKPLDLPDYRARMRRGEFDLAMSIGGTGQLNADLDSLIYKYHSTSSTNYVRAKDPELDRLLEAQRRESDVAKRQAIIKQVQTRMLEIWPIVDTIYPPRWEAWHSHLKNYRPHYTDSSAYRHAWLEK